MSRIHYNQHTFLSDQPATWPASDQDAFLSGVLQVFNCWNDPQSIFEFKSSGSTGKPKTFTFTHKQVKASALASIHTLNLRQEQHFLVCLQPHFVGSAMALIRALLLDSEITLMTPGNDIVERIDALHPFNVVSFVPTQLHDAFLSDPNCLQKLNRFETILVGGASVEPKLEAQLSGLSNQCFHTYGMTETLSHVALRKIGSAKHYTPMQGVQFKQQANQALSILCPISSEWIHTNDVVQLFPDGSIIVLGRTDFVINSGGFKIHPEQVEDAIQQWAANTLVQPAEWMVAGLPDPKLGSSLLLITTNPRFSQELFEELNNWIKDTLHSYARPKQWVRIPSLVKGENGKINRPRTIELANIQLNIT